MNHEGRVFGFGSVTEHLVQKAVAGAALLVKNTPLTQTGVHEQAEGEWKIAFLGEILYGLRLAFVFKHKIVFGQVADDRPILVAHRGKHVDYLDVDRDGWLLLLAPDRHPCR